MCAFVTNGNYIGERKKIITENCISGVWTVEEAIKNKNHLHKNNKFASRFKLENAHYIKMHNKQLKQKLTFNIHGTSTWLVNEIFNF